MAYREAGQELAVYVVMHHLHLSLPLTLMLAVACGEPEPGVPDPTEPGTCLNENYVQDYTRAKLDLLFVVDTSPSMDWLPGRIAAMVDNFANVLENVEGGLPDLQIAVISSDLGAGGHEVAGCSDDGDGARMLRSNGDPGCAPPGDAFITEQLEPWFTCGNDLDEGCATRNYPGPLAEALACVMPEPGSCTISQPLEAMKRALDGSVPENAGFVRDDAFLAVVFIGDDDDCSAAAELFDPADDTFGPIDAFRCARAGLECGGAPLDGTPGEYTDCAVRPDDSPNPSPMTSVREYADFLKAIKEDPGTIIVSAATGAQTVGDPIVVLDDNGPALAPACENPPMSATPSLRMMEFLGQFPQRNVTISTCEERYEDTLIIIAELYKRTLNYPCYSDVAIADIDPEAAGLQLDCTVYDRRNSFPATNVDLPRCLMDAEQLVSPDTPLPCWWAYDNGLELDECRLRVRVERAAAPLFTAGTWVRCPPDVCLLPDS